MQATFRPVGFGLIGCGEIAVASAKAIALLPEYCRVAAVMDINRPLAKELGQQYGVPAFFRVEELLDRSDVEAVVISTPHHLHAPLAVQAAQAGKQVVCEKPVACTLAQADEMIAACRDSGVRFGVLQVSRFGREIQQARQWIGQGALGRIIHLHIVRWMCKPSTYWSGGYSGRNQSDWRTSRKLAGGGILIMNLIHDLARLHWATGLKAQRVYAEYDTHATPGIEVEDNLVLAARYTNGALGSFVACSAAQGRQYHTVRILGDGGSLVLGRGLALVTSHTELPGMPPSGKCEFQAPAGGNDGRRIFFEQFARSVREGAPVPCPGEEAREYLAFCLAAYRSLRLGRPCEP